MSKILRFLSFVAGVRMDALDRAPNAMAQPAIFGLAIITTSTIAGSMAAYAIKRVFYGSPGSWAVAAVAGLVWASLVFAIDRSMLTIDKSAAWWRIALQVAARLALGVAIGFSISRPLFLRVARSPIDLGIREASRKSISLEAEENARSEGLPDRTQRFNSAQEEANSARTALEAGPGSSPDYAGAVRTRDAAQAHYHVVLSRNGVELENALRRLSNVADQNRADSPIVAQIQRLRAEIRDAAQSAARATSDVERAEAAWREETNGRLTTALRDLDEARRAVGTTSSKVELENEASRTELNRLTRPDLATENARADQIMDDPKNPYCASLRRLSAGLDAIFIFMESLILTIKILAPESAMDRAVKAVESEEQEKLYLEANARIMRRQMAVEATNDLYAKALEKWHTERLQLLQMNGPISARVLGEIREECADVVEAAA
jgi:hypothetical protein